MTIRKHKRVLLVNIIIIQSSLNLKYTAIRDFRQLRFGSLYVIVELRDDMYRISYRSIHMHCDEATIKAVAKKAQKKF